MIKLADGFLDGEERCGFFVPEMMKRTWAAEMEMVRLFGDFLDHLQIPWFIQYGTLLGAVRHQGFIPWDDDMDLAVFRSGYEKLLSHIDELPKELRILSIYTEEDYRWTRAVLSNDLHRKLSWDEKRMDRFFGCPFIVNIDIDILDYIPRDPEKQRIQKLLFNLAYTLIDRLVALEDAARSGEKEDEKLRQEFEQGLGQLRDYLASFFGNAVTIRPDRPLKNELCRAADFIASIGRPEESEYLDYYPHMIYTAEGPWQRAEWFEETVQLPFECMELPAPAGYDCWLSRCYGKDFRTNMVRGAAHNYPFYAKQEEYFRFLGYLPQNGS